MVLVDAAANIHNTNLLISNINSKLLTDFKYSLDISGFDDLVEQLFDETIEYDADLLRELNKSVIIWGAYFNDILSLLHISIEQYKNVQDIYDYLVDIAITNVDEFQLVAPKYKIDTRNLPLAIKEAEQKNSDSKEYVKKIKTIILRFESYEELMRSGYYKTSRLLRHIESRSRNISFVS
jgi:hypothetical protein